MFMRNCPNYYQITSICDIINNNYYKLGKDMKQEKLTSKQKKELKKQQILLKKEKRLQRINENKQKKLNKKQLYQTRLDEIKNSDAYQVRQLAKQQRYNKANWYKLDNAGLIYPAIARNTTAMFRLSVLLYEEVDPIALQKALNDVIPRFPTITCSLKAGLFWWYLDAPTTPNVVEEQTTFPCQPLKLDHKRSIIRVTYRSHEIAIEYFHSSTDGSGGTAFLNCLVKTYLMHKGIEVLDDTNCPHYLDKPRYEEMVDSFQLATNNQKTGTPHHVKALHMKGSFLPKNTVVYIKGICDSEQLKSVAKSKNATITQYITACIMYSIAKQCKETLNKDKKPIRVSVPCNLRKMFDSQTLRNFSSYFHCEYVEGDFDTILNKVKDDFTNTCTKEYFQQNINYNTIPQNNFLMRIAPLPLKNFVLKNVYNNLGYKLNSCSFSNLGVVNAPKEFSEYVARYEFTFGRTFCEPVGVTMATYNNVTTIICNSILVDTLFERNLFSLLSSHGITLAIESNEGESL